MTITYTGNLKLALPTTGTEAGTWGDVVNQQITALLDQSVSGTVSLTSMTNADYTLTNGNGSSPNEARYMALSVPSTLTLTAARNIIVPTSSKAYIIRNLTTGGFAVTLKTLAGTGISVPNGKTMILYCDGTNVIDGTDYFTSIATGNLSYTGTLTGGTGIVNIGSGQVYKDASGNLGIGTSSPTLNFEVAKNNAIGYMHSGVSVLSIGSKNNYPVSFDVNNTERMRLDASGNLGIGTSSPGAKLDVRGNATFTGNTTARQTADFTNTGGQLYVGSESSTGGAVFTGSSAYAGIVGTNTNTVLQFATNGAVKATLDTSGNLGLGVTPSAWQSIYRAAQFPAGVCVVGRNDGGIEGIFAANAFRNSAGTWTYVNNGIACRYVQESGGHIWYTAPSGTAGNAITFTQAMTLDASGNLVLGATSANARLDVVGGHIRVNEDSIGTKIITIRSDFAGLGPAINVTTSHPLLFLTANTERARIDASGNLLVGTTGAAYAVGERVSIQSASTKNGLGVSVTGAGAKGIGVYNGNSTGATNGTMLEFQNSSSGVVGSITANGTATAYNTSSDYRLKDITGPITTSGAYIDALKPVEGTWKADGSTFVGLIAHEVQEVSRTTVATGTKDGADMQGMDYSSSEIIANLIAEIQSLRKRLAALEAK